MRVDTGRAMMDAYMADRVRDTRRYFRTVSFPLTRVLIVLGPKENAA